MKQINLILICFLLLIQISCKKNSNNEFVVRKYERVVSLSPSITRQIKDLNAESILVGVTNYHPPLKRDVEIIGSLVRPNLEKIVLLQPDVVLMSQEDSAIQNDEQFKNLGISTCVFKRNIVFSDILDNYRTLAVLCGKEKLAAKKIKSYRAALKALAEEGMESTEKPDSVPGGRGPGIALIISDTPLMAVSGSSFISHGISDAGGVNVFNDLEQPYPMISIEALVIADPELIIATSSSAVRYLKKRLKHFTHMKALRKGGIYEIGFEHIAYYTPLDYITSVGQIHSIIREHKRK